MVQLLCFIMNLQENVIYIRIIGKGRCMDNIFTERLWRSVKYEEVYPRSIKRSKMPDQIWKLTSNSTIAIDHIRH